MPAARPGIRQLVGWSAELKNSANDWSSWGRPNRSFSLSAEPLRTTVRVRAYPTCQSCGVIGSALGCSHEMSGTLSHSAIRLPSKNRRRRKIGCRRRRSITNRVKDSISSSTFAQSIQDSSLSWQ